VHPASSISSSLDGEPQQDGGEPELAPWGAKLDAKTTPCPLPRLLRIKPCLLPSLFLFRPSYLSTLVPLFCQSSRNTPCLLPARYSSTIPAYSLFVFLFLPSLLILPSLFTPSESLLTPSPMPKKKSPEDFFQRAREKGSDINKAIVNGSAVKKHLEPKTEKNYARALGLWNG